MTKTTPEVPEDEIFDPILQKTRKRNNWEVGFEYDIEEVNTETDNLGLYYPKGKPEEKEKKKEKKHFPFPISNKVSHFHPVAFVEQMIKMEDDPSLIWGLKFTKEERQKVIEISNGLWGEDREIEMANNLMANNLMAVFAWESGGTFRTDAPNLANYGGTGLMQFMPPTASGLLGR